MNRKIVRIWTLQGTVATGCGQRGHDAPCRPRDASGAAPVIRSGGALVFPVALLIEATSQACSIARAKKVSTRVDRLRDNSVTVTR